MRHFYILGIFFTLTLAIAQASAQGLSTASKGQEISVFGGYSVVKPDIFTSTDTGISAGAAYTVFFSKLHVDPSIVLRGTDAHGTDVNERTVGIGLQVSRRIHKFHPYVDFLVGGGSVVFNTPQPGGDHVDKGTVYTYGGGVDYDLVHNFRLRLDLQSQSMNFGINPAYQKNGNFTLSPTLFTIGVNYVIPFRPHTGYRDTK